MMLFCNGIVYQILFACSQGLKMTRTLSSGNNNSWHGPIFSSKCQAVLMIPGRRKLYNLTTSLRERQQVASSWTSINCKQTENGWIIKMNGNLFISVVLGACFTYTKSRSQIFSLRQTNKLSAGKQNKWAEVVSFMVLVYYRIANLTVLWSGS